MLLPLARRFIEWHRLLALCLVIAGSIRIVSTYTVFSHTIDEPAHLRTGLEWLTLHKYRSGTEHPPLARVMGALGPYIAGERYLAGPDPTFEGSRILGSGKHYDRILALGRAGILPFFWIASLVVYLWGHRIGGELAALFGTLVFTTLPPILAHAGLITTDMALTALVGAAALASCYWAEKPSPARSMAFGVILALAVLSKFSALAFLPVAWSFMYASRFLRTRAGLRAAAREIMDRLRPAAVVLGVAVLIIWAFYFFSFGRLGYLHARIPAPHFFDGIHIVWEHNKTGHFSYLLGKVSTTGFWYYYPVVLGIKTPLGMLLLLLGTPLLFFRSSKTRLPMMPLAFSIGTLLFALATHINIGVRHILPVYIGLSVVCGCIATAAFESTGRSRHLARASVVCLLSWHVASGALQHPDYLAYTNEIAGDHPEGFMVDSDLDWGQDMNRLATYLARVGAERVAFLPFNFTYLRGGHPLPPLTPVDTDHPSPGWNAVSITTWKLYGFPAWAERIPPQERVGRSILLWHIPETSGDFAK